MTPASGGVLLNGATLLAQGSYTASRNLNARVRLAAAVSGNATVAASAGSLPIDAGSVAPAFGYYALVPANSPLNVSVNGASVGAPAASLVAGSDATLLVYGSPGSATATLIADDNRLPLDATTVKMRLINGVTGSAGALGLTMTANASLIANGIEHQGASDYAVVPGSLNAMNLTFTSSQTPGNFLVDTAHILNPKSVYTALVGGDVGAPLLLIR